MEPSARMSKESILTCQECGNKCVASHFNITLSSYGKISTRAQSGRKNLQRADWSDLVLNSTIVHVFS